MKEKFNYMSADGVTLIHAIRWVPEGEKIAVIQISHGMTEYADCYDEFARYMNQKGFIVTANDHLGHGDSIRSEEYIGWIDDIMDVMHDIHKLRQITRHKYPELPYIILGHSMGSYFARQYIELYGKGLAGAIFMGAGSLGNPDQFMGPITCQLLAIQHGKLYYSPYIENVGFTDFNSRIDKVRTEKDWLCANPDYIDKYLADPKTQKVHLKVLMYREMGKGIYFLQKPKNIAKIPKDLPIYLIYGEEDPVGKYGADVEGIAAAYEAAGIRSVIKKSYPGCRHHLFFETCKEQVFEDITDWINSQL